MVFTDGSDGKESTHNARDLGSIPGSGRFPWRRKWLPTPVSLPGKSHGQRRLVGHSPWGQTQWLNSNNRAWGQPQPLNFWWALRRCWCHWSVEHTSSYEVPDESILQPEIQSPSMSVQRTNSRLKLKYPLSLKDLLASYAISLASEVTTPSHVPLLELTWFSVPLNPVKFQLSSASPV